MTKDQRITPAGAGKTTYSANYQCASKDHPRRCGENAASTAFMLAASGSPPQVRGKRSGTNIYSSVGSDHPRRCGENHCSNRIDRQDNGSPPQVRGKRHFLASSNFRLGITPAGAGKTFLDEPEKEEQWDHPRRCGENFAGMDKPEGMTGSPPQVRGKLERLHEDCAITGITPAGAGKTRRCCAHRPKFQDHPRRCGENGLDRRRDPSGIGSPPQVRGKLLEKIGIEKENGITPAGAGKTARKVHGTSCIKDHPRRCGENARTAQDMRLWTGSPPQVRGKPPRCRRKSPMTRITPAGAGKTVVIRRRFALAWDHPRRCGENEMQVITARVSEGSPPQVRGKRRGYTYSLHQKRITPAGAGKTVTDTYHPHIHAGSPPQVRGKQAAESCQAAMLRITPAGAGKTQQFRQRNRIDSDHPRRCGENISDPACCSSIKGSPPQVRGKPERNISGRSGFGITPAGAGKTCFVILISSVLQDHPRRCGENRSGTVRTKTTRGSPPQVRGKPCCAFVTASRSRITPAGAGKTRYSCRMCSRSRDHPRRCGENKETMTEDAENAGSPPQVRGKLQLNAQYRLGRRITPAGAGKTTHTMEV